MPTPDPPLALIVDDNEKNRTLAADLLGIGGFRTIGAVSAAEAIAFATAHLPDVILMDLRLPDMDGPEVARTLRSDQRTSRIPIVALSALPLEDGDDWFRGSGFAGYLVKPIDVDEFVDQVRTFCVGGAR